MDQPRRYELQQKLVSIDDSVQVYYQPPATIKLQYPCIIYSLSSIRPDYADDIKYKNKKLYDLTLIDRDPDSKLLDKLLDFPYSSFDRSFAVDGLNHFNVSLFF